MSNTRELSQIASLLVVNDETRNIGIGTTNPTSKLHVSGDVRVSGVITATTFVGTLAGAASSTTNIPNLTGAITSVNTTTSLGSFTSLQLLTALTDETGTGSNVFSASPTFTGTVNVAALTASGNLSAAEYTATSDINLKENIKQVESASELVSKLEGVHFSWKETGKETIGVIAQQIEEHLPQLVQTGDTHKTVNYNGLIGVLIEAVKEQGAQIAALQAEIEELKK